MSRSIKQYVWGAAILAIAMVFIMQFRPGAQMQEMGGAASGPTCAVENDGRCIVSQGDFVTAFRLASSSRMDDDEARNQVRQLVIEGLIQRWLLLEDAERLGIRVTEEEVTRGLSRGLARLSLPVDLEGTMVPYRLGLASPPDGPARAMSATDPKTGKFDYERYKKWVQRVTNKTMKDFREYAAAEELAARMRAIIKSRARVSEQEAQAQFTASNAKIAVDYIAFSRDYYQRRADLSQAAVLKWAEQNKKEIDEAFAERKDEFASECRVARHILARIDESAEDKEGAAKKARERIDRAKQRLDNGDEFALVARELSDDAQSGPRGGELGCFAAGKLAKPNTAKAVDDAAFKLDKGKLSGVIESSFGLHLVKVDEILKGEAAEQAGKDQIAREKYLRAEGERLAAESAKQVLAAVKGGKTLTQALADQLAAMPAATGDKGAKVAPASDEADAPKIVTSKDFTASGPPFSGAENAAEAARACFAIDKVGGVAADVIKMYDGYAVAQLKENKGIDEKEWAEGRSQLLAALRDEKQKDALIAYVHALRAKYAKTITYKIKLTEEKPDKKPAQAPEPEPELPAEE